MEGSDFIHRAALAEENQEGEVMTGGMCKTGTCEGCPDHGRLISTAGKSFKCNCPCHASYQKDKKDKDDGR